MQSTTRRTEPTDVSVNMKRRPPPNSKLQKHDRRFIRRTVVGFTLVLGSLFCLVVAGYLVQHRQIVQERDTATMVSASANQRMLSQRVALLSLGLINVQSEVTRERTKKALLGEIEIMESIHQALLAGDPAAGIRADKSDAVREILFGESTALDRKVRMFVAIARSLTEDNSPALIADNPKLFQLTEISSELSKSFDKLTAQFREEGIAGILGLETLATRLLILQIGLLAVSALFVFYPTINRLKIEFYDRTVAQTELIEQNRELEQFAATVAHDLKAPLNNIGGFSQMLGLKLTGAENKETKEVLDVIDSGVRRMSQMISELLQYARLTREQRYAESVSLTQIVEKACKDFEKKILDDRAEIVVGNLPSIIGVRVQLEHLFLNLIGNALKYRHPERTPRITIQHLHVPEQPDIVTIVVEDNGRGFPVGAEERMFEPFRRLNPQESVEGSGFGLALCRKIVKRHNGNISAEHAATGGARFIVTFAAK